MLRRRALVVGPLLLRVERPFAEFLLDSARSVVQWKQPRVESTGKRYWRHPNAPPGSLSDYPAVTVNDLGSGQAMLVAANVFGDYWTKKHWYLKPAVKQILDLFGVRPVVKTREANISVELNATRDDDALQVHLITFQEMPRTQKTGLIGENPPISGLVLEFAPTAVGEITQVTLEPGGAPLEWERHGDHIAVALPEIQGYRVVEVR